MDLKGAVLKHVNEAIELTHVDYELKKAARRNHRFNQFITNIYQQLLSVEILRANQGKPKLRPQTVKDLVYSFVNTYLNGVQTEAIRRAESDISRVMREQTMQKAKDLETSSNSKTFVGEYAELQDGLTITDERDVL